MRKSRFTDTQIVAIVRGSEVEGVTVEQVAKRHGVTTTTLFRWRKRFGGLDASQAAELRQLQAENARLKKVVAQLTLDVDILKEINAKKWLAHGLAASKWTTRSLKERRSADPVRCCR